jgi:multiple sugar transport system ATP-binding protein
MLQIEIDHLDKHYGAYHALRDVCIAIPQGTFVALVGPSGCGKSTLLRTLAGLESISGGDLRIAGVRVNDVPPRQRDVAMVFQSYALYPHMTVEANMNYALKLRKRPLEEIARRTAVAAETLGLGALLQRFPRALSGGQRQRVAMGRAIVRSPKVFLFDEPLSNLDAALRVHMRKEIRKLHDRLGATSVYVTHDQIEAMTMADHVVVMGAGRVEQQGAPLTLYDRPVNQFVAGFIGSPAMNFVPAIVGGDGRSVEIEADVAQTLPLAFSLAPGRPVTIGLRPEHMRIGDAGAGAAGGLRALVDTVESTGSMTFLHITLAPHTLVMACSGRLAVRAGQWLPLHYDPGHLHVFDRQTQISLTA